MRWWWAFAMVAVVVDCGGSSMRREGGGDGDGSPDGGTSGSAGTGGGTAGTSAGGSTGTTGGRGGRGGTTSTAGRASGGGSGGGSAGSDGGDGGIGGFAGAAGSDGGAAGEPACDPGYVTSDCSPEDTCRVLECGLPWSLYDARGCGRRMCTETATCPAGERCVPAPVLGKYDDPCFYQPDSCTEFDGACGCFYYEECAPLAVCVPEDEFPPSRDCPIDDPMDCFALSRAVATLEAYRDGTEFFFPDEPPPALAASVDACAMRLAEALQAECD